MALLLPGWPLLELLHLGRALLLELLLSDLALLLELLVSVALLKLLLSG